MNVGAFLNSDVGTVQSMAARGFHWWLGQLRELLPHALRRRRTPGQLVVWNDGALTVVRKGGMVTRMPSVGARVGSAVPARLAFMRTLQLPRMSTADLKRLVELEAERLSPLPSSEMIVGVEARTDGAAAGTATVDVAVLPRRVAEEAIAAAGEAGLIVTGFGLVSEPGRTLRFDFMPALRELRLVSTRQSPSTAWWGLVAFALILNMATLIIRDQQSVARLSTIVEQQQPAVAAARTIQTRANDFDAAARDLAMRRRAHDVLAALAVVSQNLPAGAWVQRFTYNGQTARLIGYKRGTADVVAALRRDPNIVGIRSNSAQFVAETPAGQPFDVTLQLRAGR